MRKILAIFLLLLSGIGLRAQSDVTTGRNVEKQPETTQVQMNARQVADSIVSDAMKFIGRPYKYGSNGPSSFDCSGFTRYIYTNYGISLNRSAYGVSTQGRKVEKKDDLQKGDIILYDGRRISKRCGHVAIFIAWDDSAHTSFRFIHAAHRGVQITHSRESYYAARYLGARRFLPDFTPGFDIDSSAVYPFDSVGYIRPDTLTLDSADRRIVLFANKKWAVLSASGELTIPQDTGSFEQIILLPSGDWVIHNPEAVMVPEKKSNWIPSGEKTTSPSTPAPVATQPSSASSAKYHKVKSGENLWVIAKHYNTTVKALCNLNNLRENSVLHVNQNIRVK